MSSKTIKACYLNEPYSVHSMAIDILNFYSKVFDQIFVCLVLRKKSWSNHHSIVPLTLYYRI